MSEPRMRALAPELIGAILAVGLTVVVGVASHNLGVLLQLHVNRKLITALGMAAAALLVTIILLVTVLAVHAHRVGKVAAFFTQEVAPKPSAWRRGALMFLANAWPIAVAAALLGIVFP